MSNQRFGKTHRATGMDGGSEMKIYQFFKNARIALEESGNDDASFYFNQIEDHLKAGKSLPSSQRDVEHVLGL